MTLKLGFVNVVVTSSAETVKEILHTHEMEFIGRPIPDADTTENGSELALPWLSVGPYWKKLREICNAHLFTHAKLDLIQELRNQVMRNMTERVFRAQERGEAVEIKGLAFSTIVQLLSNSMFSDDLLDPASGAMEELEMLNGNIMVLLGKPNFADYYPFLRLFDLQGIRREIRKSYDTLHGLIDGIIDIRTERRRLSGGSDRVLGCSSRLYGRWRTSRHFG
ncbi:PREDICTED: geraniol 8-hydroxylase-like [Erythranthe guttata]|uniref:geraniol 8-hydroxylase-like n=1 Tax=Erythranthe guttata TaxID=4155 RepID=UPI00064DC025|nr:PREDICTED: geraniol 8-hydroxylase-like [Erythranthe guttata]|eukprot:XP_012828517.1 PREDICTED: geraniol 8-hydroxylase-like [Erythranthe guttata]